MFVDAYGGAVFFIDFIEQSGFASPRGSLPIVFAFFLRYPGRQSLAQMLGQRINERFIHTAELKKLPIRFFAVTKFHAVGCERVANLAEIRGAKTVGSRSPRGSAEDLRQIDDRVTRNCKSKISLTFAGAFDTALDQSASIEDGGQRSDPGLVVVLRTEIREHRVRKVAFH